MSKSKQKKYPNSQRKTKQALLREQFWVAVASKQGLHIRF